MVSNCIWRVDFFTFDPPPPPPIPDLPVQVFIRVQCTRLSNGQPVAGLGRIQLSRQAISSCKPGKSKTRVRTTKKNVGMRPSFFTNFRMKLSLSCNVNHAQNLFLSSRLFKLNLNISTWIAQVLHVIAGKGGKSACHNQLTSIWTSAETYLGVGYGRPITSMQCPQQVIDKVLIFMLVPKFYVNQYPLTPPPKPSSCQTKLDLELILAGILHFHAVIFQEMYQVLVASNNPDILAIIIIDLHTPTEVVRTMNLVHTIFPWITPPLD